MFSQVTTFSEYCEKKFEIEPVEVKYDSGESYIYPDLAVYDMEVPLSYITDLMGVSLEVEEVIKAIKLFSYLLVNEPFSFLLLCVCFFLFEAPCDTYPFVL